MSAKKKNTIRHLCMILFFCTASYIKCMEPAETKKAPAGEQQLSCSPKTMAALGWLSQHDFSKCIVLEADGWEFIAKEIAFKARLVHSNIKSKKNLNIANLVFTEPKENTYDYITLLHHDSTQNPKLIKNLHHNKQYLKDEGILLTLIQTQDNTYCPETQAFITLYPEIFEASCSEKVKKKLHPSDIDFKNAFYTEEELGERIDKIGYTIISYGNTTYDIIIKNEPLYLKYLKEDSFPKFTEMFDLPAEAALLLREKFANLIINTSPRNGDGYLIHRIDITEFQLGKKIQPK